MLQCPFCHRENPEGTVTCQYCNTPLWSPPRLRLPSRRPTPEEISELDTAQRPSAARGQSDPNQEIPAIRDARQRQLYGRIPTLRRAAIGSVRPRATEDDYTLRERKKHARLLIGILLTTIVLLVFAGVIIALYLSGNISVRP